MIFTEPSFEPVGYGLIGFGRFCQRRLIPAFQDLRGSRIVALQKRNASEAIREAETYGIPAGYGDLDALLNDPQVEAVYITSAHAVHEEQAVAAAGAGKHVLCEKPLATSSNACQRIIQACSQAGVLLMVAQTLRFSPVVLQMKRWMDEGKLGQVICARATFTYLGFQSPRRWLLDRRIAGGGPMIDIGVHCLDTLRFLLGDVAEVQALLNPMAGEETVEKTVETSLRFAGGALGSIFCSYEIPYGNRLDILGSQGRTWAETYAPGWIDVDLHLETNDQKECLKLNTGNTYGMLITSFSEAIRGLHPVPIPGDEGLANARVIDAIYAGRTHL